MPDDQLRVFYDTVYRGLYSGANDTPTPEFLADQEARGRRILEFVRPSLARDGTVLDVGCGAGAMLIPFKDEGHSVVGIEPGPYATWGARHLGLDIRRASVADLSRLTVEPDLILLSYVLEHVPSPKEVLQASHGLLRDKGLVFIEVPNLMQIRGPVDEYFHVAHLTYFTPETLTEVLELCGFEVVAISAGRTYSMRVLAQRKAPQPDRAPDAQRHRDDSTEIRAFVARHARMARIEFATRSLIKRGLNPVAGLLRVLIGRDRTDRLIGRLRMTARKARYGEKTDLRA